MNKIRNQYALSLILSIMLCFALTAGAMADTAQDTTKLGSITNTIKDDTAEEDGSKIEIRTEISTGTAEQKAWTVMIYLCGSDLEAKGAASLDVTEMAESDFDESVMNVLVFAGGTKSWRLDLPAGQNSLWEVHKMALTPVKTYPDSSMGEADTLKSFMADVKQMYPAEHYALILWNHGGGPIQGIGRDIVHQDDSLSMSELRDALGNSAFSNEKLEVIGFDACLMGSLEVADMISPYAKYMIASEETEPGIGWNYLFLKQISAEMTGGELGKIIVSSYFDGLEANHMTGRNNTLSCLDLNRIDVLKKDSEDFFKDLSAVLNGDTYADFAKARKDTLPFGHQEGRKDVVDFDLADMGGFVRNLEVGDSDAKTRLLESLEQFVVCSAADSKDAYGLSFYHPYYSGSYYPYYTDHFSELFQDASRTAYLEQFTSYLNGDAYYDYSGLSTLGSIMDNIQKDANTTFTLALTPEQIRFLAEAKLQVYRQANGEEGYALVSVIPETEINENNTITATYVHRALFAVDADGTIQSPALPYHVRTDGDYSVDAVLTAHDESGNENRQSVRLIFSLKEKSGELELKQILTLDPVQGAYTERYNVDLSDWETMEVVYETRRPVFNGTGSMLGYEDWEILSSEVCRIALNEGWSLQLIHDQLNREELYVAFEILDYQNRSYSSSLIPLEGAVSAGQAKLTYDNDFILLKMPDPEVNTEGDRRGVMLTVRLTNRSGIEDAIVELTDLQLNGEASDLTLRIYGDGPQEGMMPDEEELAKLLIPADTLQGIDTLTAIDFVIHLTDPAGESDPLAIPVHVEVNLDLLPLH